MSGVALNLFAVLWALTIHQQHLASEQQVVAKIITQEQGYRPTT